MNLSKKHQEIEDLVVIAEGRPETLRNFSLVLSAMGIDHTIDHGAAILVTADLADNARRQLRLYEEENRDSTEPREPVAHQPHEDPGITLLLIGMLALFFFHSGGWYEGNPWFETGAVDRDGIIIGHQWWRTVTALTLHADIVHLAGNCLIGGFMISFLSRMVGYGLCWLLVLTSGAAGNLINILVRDQQHLSVGFSTAVFGVIGIFTGLRIRQDQSKGLKKYLLPLGAGIGLLGFLGSEGARTDIGAHGFGFISGVVIGLLTHTLGLVKRAENATTQRLLLLTAIAVVFFCWQPALRSLSLAIY